MEQKMQQREKAISENFGEDDEDWAVSDPRQSGEPLRQAQANISMPRNTNIKGGMP